MEWNTILCNWRMTILQWGSFAKINQSSPMPPSIGESETCTKSRRARFELARALSLSLSPLECVKLKINLDQQQTNKSIVKGLRLSHVRIVGRVQLKE